MFNRLHGSQRIHTMRYRRFSIPRLTFYGSLTALVIIFLFLQTSLPRQALSIGRPKIYDNDEAVGPRHRLDDVFVVMRTGASEIARALPVQLNTTLSQVPDFAIFSDMEQEFHGQHVIDVLADVSDEVKRSNKDFDYYMKLKEHGLGSFTEAEMAKWPGQEGGRKGNKANPGWKLDKWKFLPMAAKAFEMRPKARWFVFIEADTYVLWPNLARWLATFDASRRHYIGRKLSLGETKFAYGGNGIAISAPAMREITELRARNLEEYDNLTAKKWAGDAILGTLMQDAGIKLKGERAMLSGNAPSAIDYAVQEKKGRLCSFSPVSFHHITPAEISITWATEQKLLSESSQLPRYIDFFKVQVLPLLSPKKDHWDNLADEDPDPSKYPEVHGSFDGCRTACEREYNCKQFSYQSGYCQISSGIKLGSATASDSAVRVREADGKSPGAATQSGWMIERIMDFLADC